MTCGGRMIVVETLEGARPARSSAPTRIWIDIDARATSFAPSTPRPSIRPMALQAGKPAMTEPSPRARRTGRDYGRRTRGTEPRFDLDA